MEAGHIDRSFILEYTQGWEAMPAFLADYPPDVVARLTGLDEADLRRAADLIGRAGSWMSCWTMGLNQSTHGTWNTNALINLHLATGAICRPGSGPFSLTGQPNAMGGREMGYMGPGLPGQRSVLDAADRAFTESVWGPARRHPARRGRHRHRGSVRPDGRRGGEGLLGDLRTNPVASVANRAAVAAGLQHTSW